MNESTVSGNAVPMSPTERARRFREKVRNDCKRLDVTIGADVVEKLDAMAKRRGVPRWGIVQEAIEALAAQDAH
ncbi:MAG: ribbon-helix-helix protein, CopG family [Betaproteobacteria bacterium]|nr:ribbon-helix-helix protein, CopG family [Betaproteobacteria bacterium]